MANVPAQTTVVMGTTLTSVTPTASTGDTVPVGSRVLIRNGSGSPINVTIDTPGNDTYGQPRPDIVTAVAAGALAMFGPFPNDLADSVTNVVKLTCSAVASVEMRVVSF